MTPERLEESIKNCKQANLCFIIMDFNDFLPLVEKVLWKYTFKSTPTKYMGILNWSIMININK